MTKPLLWWDLETYSEVPIKNGTYAYAEQAEILLFLYAFGDGEIQCWDATAQPEMPADLHAALIDPEQITAGHNIGNFDSTILRHSTGIDIPPERMIDTMPQALSHGLPGSLDALCEIFNVGADHAKHKTGKALIRLFCIPRPKNVKLRRATRETHPAEWEQFIAYGKSDIAATRVLYGKHLPRWNMPNKNNGEFALWCLDQRINRRGVCIDVEFAKAAVRAADRAKDALAIRARELTSGEVESTTQRDSLLDHILAEYGVVLDDLRKSTVEKALDSDMPEELKGLLRVRLQATTTSTSKYTALERGVSSDGRLRGTLQFAGASRTLRWGGRLFQPQNLPRLSVSHIAKWAGMPVKDVDDDVIDRYLNTGIATTLADSEEFFFEDVMPMLSNCIRGTITAPKGKKLVVVDFANIEGRVAAWLAGENWKLDAFRDYDAGTGHDLYCIAYAKSFGIDPKDVDKNQRAIGKVQELMLQYAGGCGAFVTGAAAYRIDLEKMAENAIQTIPAETLREAESFMVWMKEKGMPTFGLSDRAYIVCESFKRLWREAHPAISSYWKELDSSWRDALANPNEVIQCRKVQLQFIKGWLRVKFPDGGFIVYPQAKIDEDGSLSYMGVNQYTRKWQRIVSHGGVRLENDCQHFARCLLGTSMQPAEDAGYEICLHVHDELICETPDTDDFTADDLGRIVSVVPDYARGIPLAAAGYESYRYRKG